MNASVAQAFSLEAQPPAPQYRISEAVHVAFANTPDLGHVYGNIQMNGADFIRVHDGVTISMA